MTNLPGGQLPGLGGYPFHKSFDEKGARGSRRIDINGSAAIMPDPSSSHGIRLTWAQKILVPVVLEIDVLASKDAHQETGSLSFLP